jgi:hypothetical protein
MRTPQKILPITRREIGSGLAFAEEHDMQRLARWAAEGWRLVQVRGLYMVLERAPPEQRCCRMDTCALGRTAHPSLLCCARYIVDF